MQLGRGEYRGLVIFLYATCGNVNKRESILRFFGIPNDLDERSMLATTHRSSRLRTSTRLGSENSYSPELHTVLPMV